MIKLRFTNSIEIKIDRPSSYYPDLLVDSLKSIGFKDIIVKNDLIEFKNNIKDQNLESFQRRYGKGKITFKPSNESVQITAITEINKSFKYSLIAISLMTIILILLRLFDKIKILEFILMFGILITSIIWGDYGNKRSIENKHKELLELINENIKIASH